MGRKIFVSYKYKDTNVQALPGVTSYTWVHDYVDYLQKYVFDKTDNIYKGEKSDEDLSNESEDYIWSHLKDKLYDTSVTIVLVSPNMKEDRKWEKSQWIPWEIAYSLRETPRNGRTSHNNALLVVVLPDRYGSYSYYDKNRLFSILRDNINNGYSFVTQWDNFIKNPDIYISCAEMRRRETPSYKIVKSVY